MLEIDEFEHADTMELKLFGEVEIENGDTKIKGRNHWVGAGLGTIAAFLGTSTNTSFNTSTNSWYILLGLDTTTPTNVTMISLVNPIPTQPNFKLIAGNYYSGSNNAVTLRYTSIWSPGTVSGTIGEIGLHLTLISVSDPYMNPGMVSRLSVADNSFTAFTINTSNALNVVWYINFVYA